ncbi:unnamed protein product [Heterobilharzia americana]|nr:unnamed protein product [Heterobilharzia americana]
MIKDPTINTNCINETWGLSVLNQSNLFSRVSSPLSSSSLLVTQVDITDLQIYVILKHYLPIPIFIVSILCIVVTLIAVTQRGLWRTTVTYIVVLAVVDLFTLLSLCILSMDFFIIPALPEGLYTRIYFLAETILGEIVDTLLLISNWLTVLIATERYFAVCHPLKVRFIDCRYRRIFISFVILFCVLIKLPGFIILGYIKEISPSYSFVIFRKLYTWIVQIILYLITPFSILTFVNVRLIQTIRYSYLINGRKKLKKESLVSLDSMQPSGGLISRIRTCCTIPPASNNKYLNNQCLNIFRKITCCGCLNLQSKEISNNPLHPNYQPNECNAIMNKNELLQTTDCSPLATPPSLTASLPTGAQLGRSHREEKKITITLICLIITFFICQGPFVLTTVVMRYSSTGFYISDANRIINNTILSCSTHIDHNNIGRITSNKPFRVVDYINPISVIALALKSDLSFFFYCWFCDRFLLALKKIIRYKCWTKTQRHNHCHHQYHTHHNKHHKIHLLRKSHPFLHKLRKPRHNPEIIELNMPSGGNLLPNYQLPHHHYKYGGEYYQYRVPSDISTNNHKVIKYKKPAPLPFNLSKHKKKSGINLSINSKFSWSSPSCSDNSYKCSSPKKRSSSLGPSKDRVKSLTSLKINT